MDEDTQNWLIVELGEAADTHMQPSVAAVVSDKAENQFSGTFVRHGGRFFVATADHCIVDIGDRKTVHVCSFQRLQSRRAARGLRFVQPDHQKIGHDLVDVAVIELDESFANELKAHWIDLTGLTSAGATHGVTACLTGFPSARLSVDQQGQRPVVDSRPIIYQSTFTNRRPPNEPRATLPVDETLHLFMEYDEATAIDLRTGNMMGELHPRGMSGSGIFEVPGFEEGKVWSPDAIRLVAIQSSYHRPSKLLRLVRIEHLTALIDGRLPAIVS